MKMQRTTATRIVEAILEAKEKTTDSIIVLPDTVKALMSDVLARDELEGAIDEPSR